MFVHQFSDKLQDSRLVNVNFLIICFIIFLELRVGCYCDLKITLYFLICELLCVLHFKMLHYLLLSHSDCIIFQYEPFSPLIVFLKLQLHFCCCVFFLPSKAVFPVYGFFVVVVERWENKVCEVFKGLTLQACSLRSTVFSSSSSPPGSPLLIKASESSNTLPSWPQRCSQRIQS